MASSGPSWIETERLSSLVSLTAWRRPEQASRVDTPRFPEELGRTLIQTAPPVPTAAPVPSVGRVGPATFEGDIEARLEALLDWSVRTMAMSSAFVTDDEGLVLAATSQSAIAPAVTTCVDAFLRQWSRYAQRPRGCLLVRADGLAHVVAWTEHGDRTYFLVVSGARHDDLTPADPLVAALASALELNQR
ncbi:MAG: hypothetical protein RIT81_36130 [Deltaproteobacteria bacterium]